jgi:DNA-directed RNA polymerase subunit RPC12/RpoP
MADEPLTCADCGATVESEDDVETDEVRVVTRGLTYGDQSRNLYMCKNCKTILGVSEKP